MWNDVQMKHSNISGHIKLAVVLVVSSIFINGSAIAFDATPPKVESCTVSPRQISDVTGGNVRVTIKVASTNGLSSNVLSTLNLKNNTSSSTRTLGGFIMSRESGDEFSGTWIQDIEVKPGLMPGIYELTIFPLTDKVQNGTFFLGCPGQDVSYGVVAQTPTPTPSLMPTPTPAPTVTVTATPAPAPTVTVTATPVPAPTITVTATPVPAPTVYVTNPADSSLADSVKSLKSQLSLLTLKLKKICSAKPKPKGC